MQGKTINGYTLQHQLGMGGMAEVWYAENAIEKQAAVKLLLPKFCNDEAIVARFQNEAKVMVKLDHPNIRQVYDYGSIDGRPCIVMEYLEGDDLKALMKKGQRFTDAELRKWWNQIADALNYTHAQGIVHRDIKPSNIFLDTKGNIKLLDFGIAKIRESISMTQTGATMGTLMYMSPEQVDDAKHIGPPSDIYSLAVTFVHLLTGKAPYDTTNSSDYKIRKGIVEIPLDLTGVPDDWQAFLTPYLEKDPEKRPALKHFESDGSSSGGFAIRPDGSGDWQSPAEDEGTLVNDAPKKQEPQRQEPKKTKPMAKTDPKVEGDKPKSRKGLWIALAVAAVAAIAAFLFLRQRKQEPMPADPETEAFLACQTVADYQAFCDYYGMRAAHYAEAQHKIDSLVADSLQRAQAEAIALAIQDEEAAYQRCNTIVGCNAYLQAYPQGHYVDKVKQKKAELEDDEAFAACNSIENCDTYLRKFPQGRHVVDVRKKRDELAAAVTQNNNQQAPQAQNPQSQPQQIPQPQPTPQPQSQPQPTPQPQQSLTGTANGHEWVDLGLPSGTLWATCNVGASKPEGYGNYYAWGETSSRLTFYWDKYKYANGSADKLTKYCNKSYRGNNGFTDNLTILQSGDDPATSWGSGWRMPSKEQWDELLKHTTNQWTTQNGVKGRLFTANNGQTLFLPAAGRGEGGGFKWVGTCGDCCSCSLYTDDPNYAWILHFNSDGCCMRSSSRCSGFSVRPVRQN